MDIITRAPRQIRLIKAHLWLTMDAQAQAQFTAYLLLLNYRASNDLYPIVSLYFLTPL